MKMRAIAARAVTIAIIVAAFALLASPSHHAWEVMGLFAIWILSDLPESRASQTLTEGERAAVRSASAERTGAWYFVLVVLLGIGGFVARSRQLESASAYVVALVLPVFTLYVVLSLLTWRRLRRAQTSTKYLRAFLLTTVLQLVLIGLVSSIGGQQ